MLKNLIWDFDGTLFDTYPAMTEALRVTLKEHGFIADKELIYSKMKISVGHCLEYFSSFVDIDEAFLERNKAIRRELEEKLCFPYPGVPELLRDIIDSGRHNYIYTHRDVSLYPLLEKAGMRDLFTDIVIASHGFPPKPAPDAINYLVSKHDLIKSETAMIGDRQIDIDSGINAGVVTIAYYDGSGSVILNQDYTIHDMDEMRKLIDI